MNKYIVATQEELDEINYLTEEIKQKKLKVREMDEGNSNYDAVQIILTSDGEEKKYNVEGDHDIVI